MDAVAHLLRRSRSRSLAVAGHHAVPLNARLTLEAKSDNETTAVELVKEIQKRLTPEQLSSILASEKASALRAAGNTAVATQTNAAPARVTTPTATTATTTHSRYVFSEKFAQSTSTAVAPVTTATTPKVAAPATSSSAAVAVVPSSSSTAVVASSSSAVRSSSSTKVATAPSVAPLTSTATIRTITQTPSAVVSSAAPSSSFDANAAAAASGNSTSEGVSTGMIAGIAVGVLAGVVIVGALIGFLYRKHKSRSYNNAKAPWAKIDDDDITPFPMHEKYGHNDQDDIYGNNGAPVIGSRRALAQARQNAFNEDGSFRPDSEYMGGPGSNHAGVGSGLAAPDYGAYPSFPTSYRDVNNDPRRSSVPSRGPPPSPYTFNKQFPPQPAPAYGNSRQLVGPHGYPELDLAPHALGRPLPPTDHFAIADHEDYADMPDPLTPTNVDDGDYMPRTATTMGEWGGNPHPQPNYGAPMMMPVAAATPRYPLSDNAHAPPAAAHQNFPVPAPPPSTNAGLPSFEPMSPLMSEFDLRRQSGQPLAMYEDEKSQQKRMYGEVASAAHVPEPPTPRSANADAHSTFETSPSFSGHEPMPARLPPALVVNPPQPYIHGRPLSPLNEIATPMSAQTGRATVDHPVPSSSLLHEVNPYERTLLGAKPQQAAPPYSASSAGATGFPSPAYPPPSPGGMSVPGSVTDSPQRWDDSTTRGRRVPSMFDEEDAYGGI